MRPGGRPKLRFAVSAPTQRRIERSLGRIDRWAAPCPRPPVAPRYTATNE
jgi:hypothetical protein